MQLLLNILITGAVTIASTIGAYNYLPLSFIEQFGPKVEKKLGATITTIAGTDTISSSRSTINTNFANLNSEVLGVLTPARFTATSTTASSSIAWGLEIYQRALAIGTTATTTIRAAATSSFNGGISTTASLDIQSTSATSTFGNGISLTRGCITMPDGVCAITSGIAGSGTTNQLSYFSAATTIAGDTDFTVNAGTGVLTSTGLISTNSTSTNATSTSLQVSGLASTSQVIVGSLGVGVATTTQRNMQVAGDAQITGALNVNGTQVGGIVFLATPVNSVNSTAFTNGTFTDIDITSTTTPDVARFVIINVTMRCTFSTFSSGDGCITRFRQNGSAVTLNLPRIEIAAQVVNVLIRHSESFIVPVDSGEIFEYDWDDNLSGQTAASGQIQIDTVGYIK